MTALAGLRGLVVVDEVQRAPELFPVLRVLVDRGDGPRFLVLGSASPALLRQSSESLAGRIEVLEVPPLRLDEVGPDRAEALHPRSGASWEGFALEEVLARVQPDEVYLWATHAGAELDLLALKDGRRLGFEFERADAPGVTKSMRIAAEDLRLDQLTVVVPGGRRYPLGPGMEVVPLAALVTP
jgi:predicted AAA+ superfamily ATPase